MKPIKLKCQQCDEEKEVDKFYRHKKTCNGYRQPCKKCTSAHEKKKRNDLGWLKIIIGNEKEVFSM